MCLYSDRKATKAFLDDVKRRFGHTDVFVPVYKWLYYHPYDSKLLKSPYQSHVTWESGVVYTIDSVVPSNKRKKGYHDQGYHVYLTRKDANMNKCGNTLVKLYVLASSLFGVNPQTGHAVFGTVMLTPEEYNKACKE